ncbi:isoprenylcysteine carboxylmethyltransferase family protein [Paraburkholderia sp. MPAMCS5]|uniref:methyltransferase family protein n=1 Tax=Paraburkholderia sp. MPAMCS5 TaxID=3112563 RepID=UPI002E16BA43|nr:isoprenylcysteine carboxylmethyltransferase family protein [Paraburkholderia sp. MPAMCS5]
MEQENLVQPHAHTAAIHFDNPVLASFPSSAARLTSKQLAIEIALRVCTVSALSVFLVSAIIQVLKDPSRVTLLLFLFTSLLDIGLVVFTRVARERDLSPVSMVMSITGTFYYVAFRMEPGIHLVPETAAVSLQIVGIVIQLWSKLTLRRSFGLLPANRGVVVSGPYRILRHPIYVGYMIRNVGFLLPNFGLQNLVVFAVHFCVQICRIAREEHVLSKDKSYREYMSRVRYRLIFGVY